MSQIMQKMTNGSEMEVFRELDVAMATVSLIVFSVGLPGNIAVFVYFLFRGKDLPSTLYIILSFTDSLLCLFILPVGLSLAYHRELVLFSSPVICTMWGAVWTWAPYMSVFLIAVLSITRTMMLLNPLRIINRTTVIVVVVVYGTWIAVRMATPMVVEGPVYNFLNTSVECMWTSENSALNNWSLITVVIFLAPPVIPILVSCIITNYVIVSSILKTAEMSGAGRDRKRNATITVIILTGTYLFFNFPLFLYLSCFTYFFITDEVWLWGSVTIDSYLWTNVYIVLIAVNSLANFIIYICRIRNFRKFCFLLLSGKLCASGNVLSRIASLNHTPSTHTASTHTAPHPQIGRVSTVHNQFGMTRYSSFARVSMTHRRV